VRTPVLLDHHKAVQYTMNVKQDFAVEPDGSFSFSKDLAHADLQDAPDQKTKNSKKKPAKTASAEAENKV
jgi:hypothetical protein